MFLGAMIYQQTNKITEAQAQVWVDQLKVLPDFSARLNLLWDHAAGDSNKEVRRSIMQVIKGKKLPLSVCGVKAIAASFNVSSSEAK